MGGLRQDARVVARRPPADLTAYDLYLRGYAMAFSSAGQSPEALRLMEEAIARDPRYGRRSPAPRIAVFGCLPTVGVRIGRQTV